jgi:hypothetical protein
VIEADQAVLALMEVQAGVRNALLDDSVSVREAAVDLVGRHIGGSQDLALAYFDVICKVGAPPNHPTPNPQPRPTHPTHPDFRAAAAARCCTRLLGRRAAQPAAPRCAPPGALAPPSCGVAGSVPRSGPPL